MTTYKSIKEVNPKQSNSLPEMQTEIFEAARLRMKEYDKDFDDFDRSNFINAFHLGALWAFEKMGLSKEE